MENRVLIRSSLNSLLFWHSDRFWQIRTGPADPADPGSQISDPVDPGSPILPILSTLDAGSPILTRLWLVRPAKVWPCRSDMTRSDQTWLDSVDPWPLWINTLTYAWSKYGSTDDQNINRFTGWNTNLESTSDNFHTCKHLFSMFKKKLCMSKIFKNL